MDSSSSSLSSLGQAGATEFLKQMLNVGNCDKTDGGTTETPIASLDSETRQQMEHTSNSLSSEREVHLSTSQHTNNGSEDSYSPKEYITSNDQSHSTHSVDQPLGHMSSVMENGKVDDGSDNLQDIIMKMGRQIVTNQQISLIGDDIKNSFSVYGCEVDIISSQAGTSTTPRPGSNKVKISPVVNFDWGHKHYVGKLVAVHRDGTYMAYVTKGKSGGMVRVLNKKTEDRAGLRGFTGRVIDIAFAHLSAVLLASVDEVGNLFIHDILEGSDGKINIEVVLQVNRPENTALSDSHRVIWCPYIPDEDETSGTTVNTTADSSVAEDISKLLVLTHDKVAEMWNIDMVTREHGTGQVQVEEVTNGYLPIKSHTAPIVDASFSPDGTALATASLDGKVKFFQVYMHEKGPPRCLHEWKPHDGQPLASLFFLDDHKHPNPQVQFWKFAVTGANNNREIKIWSCESWICLQTIRILPSPDVLNLQVDPCLKAEMDLASQFLILSDINGKVLYVMQLFTDDSNSRAHVSSISEFLLTQPCLSFAVVDASYRKFPQDFNELESVADLTTGEVGDEDDDEELDQQVGASNVGILVKMYSVHTRVLQELQIRYKAESSVPQIAPGSLPSFSQDETALIDHLSDISMNTTTDSYHLTDHSTSSPRHLPPSQLSEPASGQDTLITLASQNTVTDKMSDVSSLTSYTSPSESARQAAAHADVLLSDMLKDTYRDMSSTPGSSAGTNILDALKDTGQQRPLLMTPDAFLSSHRRDTATVEDSVRSSGSSSFTQVTAMDDDQLRTPRAPASHSHPSPGSSITLTPASSHDLSALGSPHTQGTPTSLPLPPPTPGEDAALSAERLPSGDAIMSQGPRSPESKFHMPSQANSQEFYTSSPASQKTKDFRPPVRSDSEAQETSSETMDELFHNRVSKPRQILHSTGSSSSTSLEVLEILEGVRKHGQDVTNEEEDADDAMPRQDIGQHSNPDGQNEQSENEMAFIENGSGLGTLDNEEHDGDSEEDEDRSVKYDERIWPKPPDPVQVEAHRMASEAIVRAANMTSGYDLTAALSEEDPDVVIEEVQGEQQDDVAVEEEKEEIIEEIHHQEDGGKIIMHTHDRPLPSSTDVPLEPSRPLAIELPSLKELKESVQQMVHLLQTQQQEIEQLRSEVKIQRETTDTVSSLQSHIANLESALTSRLAGALDQHSQSESQRLQQVLGERETQERLKHDQMVNTLSQTLNKVLSSKLERCVQEEMRKSVLPAVTKLLDPIKNQLHNDLAQKLTATDAVIKEHIGKLVRSKHVIEAIGGAAGNAIQGPIQAACRDVLIPSFDRGCQSICHQINETFHRGTQEYIQQLESHMEQTRHSQEESRDPVIHQLQAMVDVFKRQEEVHEPVYKQLSQITESLQSCSSMMQNSNSCIETTIKQSVSGLKDSLTEQINRIIDDKVVRLLHEQQVTINDQLTTVIRSQAPTPVPSTRNPHQIQTEVLMLLKQGQLNSAFQQALSASDLKLVMFVCESVDPVKVFNQTPCPLQQPVLLSLIQQLSADIGQNLEIKHKYLEEAVMNLDMSDPVTREHLPAVVGQLCQKLSDFIQKYPQNNNTRHLKMLLRVAQSLLK